ncbi:unnamed protein product [Psylliodes chrysocephalus]|uniref:Rho guanine nucleotide exchange factor n=1 Tax=Psylliodes chrysocephalus TaxID=3402493 RepID=A0A9P0D724_9CUCU|nr:unnamed protein product [Psylliodes chrysocephala]
MSNILDSVGRSPKTPKRNESVDKAKCVTPLRIELQSFNSQTCKSGDKTEFLTPLSVKLESLDLKTPKSENKTKCLTPLSVKLEYLDINSIKSGNDKKLKVEVDNYIPTHINPVHKGTIAVTKNLTPFSGKLDQLDVCPLTNLEYKQIRCTSLRNTPKRNRPATKTANSTQFSINQLDSVGSNKRFFEMNTTQKPILNVTLKDLQYNGVDPSTPQAHVQFSQELKKVLNERNILTCKTRKHVFDALDELKKTDEDESRRNKREKSLLEIVNSEIKYVHQLEIIIMFFLKPTQERKLLRSEDFQTLFGHITPIHNINKELLLELEESSNNVAKAFWRIAPFFKVYSVYACEFKNILNILQNARTLNPQFAKFVENQESRPEVQSKLSALLITPIQRVPRYKLLLTQLLELTEPSEDDYTSLAECLEKISEAADHINKIVEDQENMQRLLELQRCLKSGEPNIIKPGRMLIKEGILNKMATKNTPSEKLYTVLMNDILLFGKMKREELKVNSLKCFSIFPLGKCKVLEILDKGCMKILCQDEELILYHEQFSETKSWIDKVRECIEVYICDRKTLRKDSSSRRPVKRKDLHEYHEIGLSPGIPLKKKKTEADNISGTRNIFKISGRKPITRTPMNLEENPSRNPSVSSNASTCHSSISNTTEDSERNENVPKMSKEVFIFGKPHPNDAGFKSTGTKTRKGF